MDFRHDCLLFVTIKQSTALDQRIIRKLGFDIEIVSNEKYIYLVQFFFYAKDDFTVD